MTLSVKNTTRYKLPSGVLTTMNSIASEVHGPEYDLSLYLCGDKISQEINKETRGKTYTPNVLSFPLGKSAGEMILNPNVAKKEAKKEGVTQESRILTLFIHGAVHLTGLDHGKKMDRLEEKLCQIYLKS
jgi:probable rRNA maturation factor